MKKILFIIVAALGVHCATTAQQTNIVVSIAKKSSDCISDDLGYQLYYGAAKNYELEKKAVADAKSHNPGWTNIESKNNTYWSDYLGSYCVIISTTTKDSSGCTRHTYGVGFGTDYSSALKNAESHLNGRNWTWSKSRDGYTVVHSHLY